MQRPIKNYSVFCKLMLALSIFSSVNMAFTMGTKENKKIKKKVVKKDNIELCQFEKVNKCQSKSSGGHIGSIHSTADGYCAKKFNPKKHFREKAFYQDVEKQKSANLTSFLPRFGGLCKSKKGKVYLKLENLKKDFLSPWELDVKIGKYTTSKRELIEAGHPRWKIGPKLGLHFLLDHVGSSSRKCNFRISNMSKDVVQDSSLAKFWDKTIMRKRPLDYFKKYFLNENVDDVTGQLILQCFQKKVSQLDSILKKKALRNFIWSVLHFYFSTKKIKKKEKRK